MQSFLKNIIKEAGHLAKGYYHQGVEHHYKFDSTDLVTAADKAVNDFLIQKIRERFPEHGIISEETEDEINPGAEYTWVIDPIDGTRNFANHISMWCVMVGVTKNGQPYLGAIYDAINGELFFAEVGKGAFVNDQPIKVSARQDPKTCYMVLSTGINNTGSPYDSPAYPRFVKFLNNLLGDTGMWFMNLGTALALAHLAAGRIDAVAINGMQYHDVLPGYVIATEAGAVFTNSEGQVWVRGRKDVVAANPVLHDKLMKLF